MGRGEWGEWEGSGAEEARRQMITWDVRGQGYDVAGNAELHPGRGGAGGTEEGEGGGGGTVTGSALARGGQRGGGLIGGRQGRWCIRLADKGLKGRADGRCAALQSASAEWSHCLWCEAWVMLSCLVVHGSSVDC